MGNPGAMLGTAGGAGGTGFGGPEQANIQTPASTAQALEQYKNMQAALAQQAAFAQAVQPGGQQALQSQQQLLGDLQGAANGQGPNPAMAQLNQTTGQNVANQAALMAGQRGASANTGLMARQAAQQGAATQQNAVGQAATLGAQQQISARQQLAQQQQAMVGQQAAATGANTNASLNAHSNITNAINAQNNAQVSSQASVNNANAALAGIQMQGQQNMLGSFMSMLGGSAIMGAEGGEVGTDLKPQEAPTQAAPAPQPTQPAQPQMPQASATAPEPMKQLEAPSGPQSSVGQYFSNSAVSGVQAGNTPAPAPTNIPTIQNAFHAPGEGGGGLMGGGGGGIMSLAGMMSDENAKTNKKSGKKDIEDFMDKTKAHTYKYDAKHKDAPGAGKGEYTSPMAQDLEKSKVGKSFVQETAQGKAVDYGKGFGAMMAAIGNLNERLRGLEGHGMANGGEVALGPGVQSGNTPDPGAVSIPTIKNAFEDVGKKKQEKPKEKEGDPSKAKDGAARDWEAGGGNAGQSSFAAAFTAAKGGMVPALLSPGERVLSPEQARAAAGGQINPMQDGKKVPGKAKVGGAKNDYANDTHATALEEGSIVIPRSITQGKNAERNAMDFVRKTLAKHKKSK